MYVFCIHPSLMVGVWSGHVLDRERIVKRCKSHVNVA